MMTGQNLREQKGLQIANAESQVTFVEENFYTVLSQSGNGEYAVSMVDNEALLLNLLSMSSLMLSKHVFKVLQKRFEKN
jgi:hypothetical protein